MDVPFLGCGFPILTDVDSQGASSLDELLMGADHMVGKYGGVTTRGLEVEVAEQSCGDVQREPGTDQLGREQSSEVVRVEHDLLATVRQAGRRGGLELRSRHPASRVMGSSPPHVCRYTSSVTSSGGRLCPR